jgi:hypothetical protein
VAERSRRSARSLRPVGRSLKSMAITGVLMPGRVRQRAGTISVEGRFERMPFSDGDVRTGVRRWLLGVLLG